MKKVLYVLIAVLAISFGANANQSDVQHSTSMEVVQSDPCDPSDLFLGPIAIVQGNPPNCADYTFSVPTVFGCWWTTLNGFYSFVVTDATGSTIAFVPNTPDTTISVTLPAFGQYFVHVQYSYVDVNGVGQSVSVATDFYYDGCETPCPPNSISLGPISVVQGPTAHCADFIISVPPVIDCYGNSLNGFYRFLVYESGNSTYPVAGRWITESNSVDVKLGYEGQYTIIVEYHYTDINGVQHTITETLNFVFDNCDCSQIEPPSVFDCEIGPSGVVLGNTPVNSIQFTWDEPNNVTGYEYELVVNDPSCCSNGGSVFNTSGKTSRFSKLSVLGAPCFSMRVRSICADGTTKSAWSDWICSCTIDDLGQDESRGKSLVQIEKEVLSLLAVPNPARDFVDITFSGLMFEQSTTQSEVVIHDLAGKEVHRSNISLFEMKRVDLRMFKPGLYMISLIDNGVVMATEKLLVR